MPCSDITEVLQIEIDAEDRLVTYSLLKQTCGGSLGKESLLLKWAGNRSVAEILETDFDRFRALFPTDDPVVEFVRLKHFVALQKGLAALLGTQSAQPTDACAVDTITYLPDGGVRMLAELKVDVLTDEIKACGGCGSCATGSIPTKRQCR